MRFADTALAIVAIGLASSVHAQNAAPSNLRRRTQQSGPVSATESLKPLSEVAVTVVPPVDRAAVAQEDAYQAANNKEAPPRFAIANPVRVTARARGGGWEETLKDGTEVWRHRVESHGCNSLNFAFTAYDMPPGGKLYITDAETGRNLLSRPLTDKNNGLGEAWTPIVPSCDVVIEVNLLPGTNRKDLQLKLGSVQVGYRGFNTKPEKMPGTKGTTSRRRDLFGARDRDHGERRLQSGSCNVDVACVPDGDDWHAEIPSVAVISTGGSTFCTGSMLNNVRQDRTPYFLTANHCGISSGNAASLVTYWKYQEETCDGNQDPALPDTFLTGSVHRISNPDSDMTLVEMNEDVDTSWIGDILSFAGWDRSGDEASSAVAIHHPSTDVKKISFENQPTTTSSYGGNPGSGTTHVRVHDWDSGTTEPGSSGSPLFNQDHRVIGQLHGGGAACGNNQPDWYGKFSVSWEAGLAQWLDPDGSGDLFVDTLSSAGPTPPPAPTPPPTPTPAPTPCTGMAVEVKILTDNYPGETEWTLTESGSCLGGDEKGSGGPYANSATWYSQTLCLQPGEHQFVITDSYGDGICCGYGSGKYEILDSDGDVLAEGGQFGQSDTKTIGECGSPPTPPPQTPPTPPPTNEPTPSPTPAPTNEPTPSPTPAPTTDAPTFFSCQQYNIDDCTAENECQWIGTCHNCGCVPLPRPQ